MERDALEEDDGIQQDVRVYGGKPGKDMASYCGDNQGVSRVFRLGWRGNSRSSVFVLKMPQQR
jgi:hypothetical protein